MEQHIDSKGITVWRKSLEEIWVFRFTLPSILDVGVVSHGD